MKSETSDVFATFSARCGSSSVMIQPSVINAVATTIGDRRPGSIRSVPRSRPYASSSRRPYFAFTSPTVCTEGSSLKIWRMKRCRSVRSFSLSNRK